MKYQGFLKDAHVITNGGVEHNKWNVDIEGDKDMPALCPYEEGSLKQIQWKVIRSNSVDPKASNVMYSTIQRVDGDRIEFAYFHTAKCPHKVGTILKSGDVLCYLAWNGVMTGYHIHLSPRYNNMKTSVNPAKVVVTSHGTITKGHYVAGQPKITVYPPMNIQAGSVVQVITSDKLNIRETPSTTAKVVGQLNPNDKVTIVAKNPQSPISNGYEWSPIPNGWIAVQVMSTGVQWVKVVAVPETDAQKIARLEAENAELKAQIVTLTAQNTTLSAQNSQMSDLLEVYEQKCKEVKAIVCN